MSFTADGTALVPTHARFARLLKHTSGFKRGQNLIIPHRHGEWSDPDKWYAPVDLLLEVGVLLEDTEEHLSEISRLLGKSTGHVTLAYTDPYKGAIRAAVELLADPMPTQDRFTYLFRLRNPAGFWEDAAATSVGPSTTPAVTTGGDRPIDDMTVTFAGPGTATHTDENGVVSNITVDAAAGAGTYDVDCGARTVKKASAHQDSFLTVDQPWWWRFSPAAAQTITSTVNITVSWRNKSA